MIKIVHILIANALSCAAALAAISPSPCAEKAEGMPLRSVPIQSVRLADEFWSPKFEIWRTVTVNDIFDKFAGDYSKTGKDMSADKTAASNIVTFDPHWFGDAFANFDRVAAGERGKGGHVGKCFFDGLIYGSIRAGADLLAARKDPALEARLDGFIDRIVAAQSPDGYLNTKVDLEAPQDRFEALGSGGFIYPAWHERYNMGGLVEAGVHYYAATGKTKLLQAAVKLANLCCDTMGPPPKKNAVPAHALPEGAFLELYALCKAHPELEAKLGVPLRADDYLALVKFWISNRGNHCGIRNARNANDARFPKHNRMSLGSYAQDAFNPLTLSTIDGHAVRATMLAQGIAGVAAIGDADAPTYRRTANAWWDNMTGRRLFLSGGVGSNTRSEAFGADYYIPASNSYLETCAAVGAGFFSIEMAKMEKDAKYVDALERVLYNGALCCGSLKGDTYTYQNVLNADNRGRWVWNGTPCCPPMFLKMMAAMPSYIYATDGDNLYVQLFAQNDAAIALDGRTVELSQKTRYPFSGKVALAFGNDAGVLTLRVRIPAWARGVENPYGLYERAEPQAQAPRVSLNGEAVPMNLEKGYLVLRREWRKGDTLELDFPLAPRRVRAHRLVEDLAGQNALMLGPVLYTLEQCDNPNVRGLWLDTRAPLTVRFDKELLGGTWVVEGSAVDKKLACVPFKAIPFYKVGNRGNKIPYRTWLWAYPPKGN